MPKKINIPFTNKISGGAKNTFRLLNDKQLNINYKISTLSLLKVLEYLVNNKKEKKSDNKINFEKGSNSKKYYMKLNKK